jgi:hypothetical protein
MSYMRALIPIVVLAPGCDGAQTGGTQTGDEGDGQAAASGKGSGGAAGASAGAAGGKSGGGAGKSSGGANAGGSAAGGDHGGGSSNGGASGSGSSAGAAGTSPTDDCEPSCGLFSCCSGTCVNFANDINNCGGCGITCEGPNPFCDSGQCGTPPCSAGTGCAEGATCCVDSCCGAGELCCQVTAGVSRTGCYPPENDTCPKGCLECDCAAPDTPIATPSGDRPIAELRPGDLVYSIDHEAIVAVPLRRVNTTPVQNHRMVRLELDDGAVIELSPGHPLAGRGRVQDLVAGAELGERTLRSVTVVPYAQRFTYDILPDSSTGTYFAAGALMGSTLF